MNREEIEAIRQANPIETVVAAYVELRPQSRLLAAHCPFHEDRTPSLMIYRQSQSWYCFGCSAGGDVFDFVQRIEKVTFAQALQRLNVHVLPTRRVSPPAAKYPYTEPMLELSEEHFTLLTAATEVYHATIFNHADILEYLCKRGLDLNRVREHRIGYATGNDLERYFRFRGWNSELAEELGLVVAQKEHLPRREYFRERIILPEMRDGRTIYLVGRATRPYQKVPYMGLPGAPKPLYGLEHAVGSHEVFVVEGTFDWLTLVGWGYPAVALLGSHLKKEHVAELASFRRIYVVTDFDEPGRKAATELARTFGARAVILPPIQGYKDVNELVARRDARELFARLVRAADRESIQLKG